MAIRIRRDNMGVVFTPRKEVVNWATPGVLYPRVLELKHAGEMNGTLLALFDHYTCKEPAKTPIMRSEDGGVTWEEHGIVEDTHYGYGMRFQPTFTELQQDCADLPAGTLLFAACAVPISWECTKLLFHISRDHGKTWEYRSTIVEGGRPIEQNFAELGPVWEPCIYVDAYGRIVVAYTDERPHTNPLYNQTIALVVSEDGGKTWSEPQYTVKVPVANLRPGMPVVARMGNGKYIMVYEMVGYPSCDINYKLSDDGIHWGDPASQGRRAETKDGLFLGSMPYVIWVPQGGENGTVIVSAKREGEHIGMRDPATYLVNYNYGEGEWFRINGLMTYNTDCLQAGWSMGMALVGENTLIQLGPTPLDKMHMQISFSIGTVLEE